VEDDGLRTVMTDDSVEAETSAYETPPCGYHRLMSSSFLRSSMRLVVAALLGAAPVLAQSPTDDRAALLAAVRDVVAGDDRVTTLTFDDPTHVPVIAKALGGRVAEDSVLHVARKGKPPVSASVRVLPARLRADTDAIVPTRAQPNWLANRSIGAPRGSPSVHAHGTELVVRGALSRRLTPNGT
jgi:hypothetical protein